MAESDNLTQPGTSLLQRYRQVRAATLALVAGLSPEDCVAQSMPDASPAKWHLAHVTWFFETFILEKFAPHFQAFDPAFRMLFNSYYNGVGDKHVRAHRGLLTRPSLAQVLAYREHVDERMAGLIADDAGSGNNGASAVAGAVASLVELGLHHEQQHQELLVTDIKHLFSLNPLYPARHLQAAPPSSPRQDRQWIACEGGLAQLGHEGTGFCFDNELPRHRVFIEPFQLASRLVSNGEYLAFMQAGGYDEPALWLSEGWEWRQVQNIHAPFYWRGDGSGWKEFTLHGLQALDLQAPVNHLSYFEADACARWHGARLPTEAEWEWAAGRHEAALHDLYGSRWQWTSSSYAPYPGYQPAAGAIGEYNGKFMANQYVLRGSSFATPAGHARRSYRNFFPSAARWQFTGLRLARSA